MIPGAGRPRLWAVAAGLAMLAALSRAAPALIEDSMAQRLAACSVCHGKQGRSAPDGYHPRIAGKPVGYLYNQLQNFRDGRRGYGPMVSMVGPLPDDYLLAIARHFAALDLPYEPPLPSLEAPAVLARGRQLALQGDASQDLPACSACHGAALNGMQPATPGLLGLPRDYLVGQFGAWVTGQRRAHPPDCMAQLAKRLAGSDIAAVAAWLSSQPLPADSRAAAEQALQPPLSCGSAVRRSP